MSELNEFLANVENEGENLDQVTETPAESLPESNQTESTPSSQGEPKKDNTENEENLPFHKHPRWKQKQAEIESLRKTIDELAPLRDEVAHLKEEFKQSSPKEETPIPQWFLEMFGDNVQAWKVWEKKEAADEARYKSEVLSLKDQIKREFQEEQIQKQEESKKMNQWIDNEINQLESEGKKFNKNELLKVIDDYRPIDEKGNWDFHKAYELLEMKKQLEAKNNNSQARKQIAALSSSENSSEQSTRDYATNLDFSGGKRGF